MQIEIAPVNPRFLAVAPRTIATACLATSLSPFRYWTASPRKAKIVHLVLDLNHLRLSRDFYLISAHKHACPEKTFKFFSALPNIRSSLEGDGRSHEESLSLILGFDPGQVLWWVFLWLLSECPLPPLLVASAMIHKANFRTWLTSFTL